MVRLVHTSFVFQDPVVKAGVTYAVRILATMMHRVKTRGMITSALVQLVCQAETVRLS